MKIAKSMVDIANIAGVSVMTVHRAIHNHPGINPHTRTRILEIASEFNYRPNAFARAVRKGKFASIGLATGYASIEIAVIVGIFRVLNAEGISLAFAELPDNKEEGKDIHLPKFFTENMIDGVIIHSAIEKKVLLKNWLSRSQIPYVYIIKQAKFNCVYPDYSSILPSSLDALVMSGYRKIVYIGPVEAPIYHHSYFPHMLFKNWKPADGISKEIIATDISIPQKKWREKVADLLGREKKRIAFLAGFEEARACHSIASSIGRGIPFDTGILCIGTRRNHTDTGHLLSGLIYSNYELGDASAKMILEKISRGRVNVPSVKLPFKKVDGDTLSPDFFLYLNQKKRG
ncbi:MAG TPA: LacI family DNA-binding transcriptional regulator [Victivallales bacterium]|nr:LacI family DNA-binding transcriptional regulator [Victivallales bacterium]HRU00203.1 LacI family DNA-binding transcriptional regulator [Victivallales bacterium]